MEASKEMAEKKVAILVIIDPQIEQAVAEELEREGVEVFTAHGDPLLAIDLLKGFGHEKVGRSSRLPKRLRLIASKGVLQASGESLAEVAWALADKYGLNLEPQVLSA